MNLVHVSTPILAMLQRPRNILNTNNSPQLSQDAANLFPLYYHSPPISSTQFIRHCQLKSDWDKKTAQLAARWIQTSHQRRRRSLKRSMVKQLASGKTTISNLVVSGTKSTSTAATQDSVHGGPCLRDSDVCEANLNQAYVGRDRRNPFDCGLADNTDSMEGNRAAGAVQQPTDGRQDQEVEMGLTVEEYVAHRKRLMIGRVMAEFQRWLDKRLAILSYAIEASEASDETASGTSTTDSQSTGANGNRSEKSTARPKRQLSDNNDPGDPSGGDDNGRDRGGNKRAKTDVDPEDLKLSCPFHKHNPTSHRKEVCMRTWKSIHRLKEHLYRVHLLPKHFCPRCTLCFDNDKELQAHLRVDEPCKKLNVIREEGIDQDTERKLRERKKHKSGQTEVQRWNDIYLLLFPDADRNAIPSPYPDTTVRSQNFERYKRVETRIKKELPRLVQQQVERKFEKVEVDVLHGMTDIVRKCLADFFRNNMSQDEGSSTTTPQILSRATTPSLPSVEESCVPSLLHAYQPQMNLDCFLPGLDFDGGFEAFDFSFSCGTDMSPDGFGVDKLSDSGYDSRTT